MGTSHEILNFLKKYFEYSKTADSLKANNLRWN
jgi:hypothetical protein